MRRDQLYPLGLRLDGRRAVVVGGGTVAPGDPVEVGLPPLPHHPLLPV